MPYSAGALAISRRTGMRMRSRKVEMIRMVRKLHEPTQKAVAPDNSPQGHHDAAIRMRAPIFSRMISTVGGASLLLLIAQGDSPCFDMHAT
jgi:hypothetical protein